MTLSSGKLPHFQCHVDEHILSNPLSTTCHLGKTLNYVNKPSLSFSLMYCLVLLSFPLMHCLSSVSLDIMSSPSSFFLFFQLSFYFNVHLLLLFLLLSSFFFLLLLSSSSFFFFFFFFSICLISASVLYLPCSCPYPSMYVISKH